MTTETENADTRRRDAAKRALEEAAHRRQENIKSQLPQKKAGKKAQNLHVMGTGRKKASSQIFNLNYADLFWRLSIKSSTTPGSASVDVSPRLEKSSSAIFLKIRRMILPDRVLGKPGAN